MCLVELARVFKGASFEQRKDNLVVKALNKDAGDLGGEYRFLTAYRP